MNRSVEAFLRLINLTSSGLLAGSLGFGNAALIPGWEEEVPRERNAQAIRRAKYFNAIGPAALATSLTLAIGARHSTPARRVLDTLAALSLAGVLGTTFLGTVPINRRLEHHRPLDYESHSTRSLAKSWTVAHSVRIALGVSAFVCAAAANVIGSRRSSSS